MVARNSSSIYKGKAVEARQVGREQGIRYVLETIYFFSRFFRRGFWPIEPTDFCAILNPEAKKELFDTLLEGGIEIAVDIES